MVSEMECVSDVETNGIKHTWKNAQQKRNICKKEGHIAKMCKSDQKKTHIRRFEEDESSDSEELETEQSDSDSESQTSSEVNTSVDSFDDNQTTYQKAKRTEKVKKKSQISRVKQQCLTESKQLIGKLTEVKPKSNDTVELKMKLNGRPVTVILDTGSPISIIPKSLRDWINPKKCKPVPENRQFVVLNDNEVEISEIICVNTELNGVESMMDWWEIKSDVKPILGMDNFGKLNLRIIQGKPEQIGIVRTETERLMFEQKTEQEFGELFNRKGTIRNFKYGVTFKDDFVPFEQKGRKIPIVPFILNNKPNTKTILSSNNNLYYSDITLQI